MSKSPIDEQSARLGASSTSVQKLAAVTAPHTHYGILTDDTRARLYESGVHFSARCSVR